MLIWVETSTWAIPTFRHLAFHCCTQLPSYCLISISASPLPLKPFIQWSVLLTQMMLPPVDDTIHLRTALRQSDCKGRTMLFLSIYIHGMPAMCHIHCVKCFGEKQANKIPEVQVMITHGTHYLSNQCLAEDLAYNRCFIKIC